MHPRRHLRRIHDRLRGAAFRRRLVQRVSRRRFVAESVAVREEHELRACSIERRRLVVAAAREQRRRRAAGHCPQERAVLRRIARDDRVRQNLGAVVEREREHVRQPLFGARRKVAKHQRRSELPAIARCTAAAATSTTATAAGGVRRATPRGRVARGRAVGLGHVGEPRSIRARQSEGPNAGDRRDFAVRQAHNRERLAVRGRRPSSPPRSLDFGLQGLRAHDDESAIRRDLRRSRRGGNRISFARAPSRPTQTAGHIVRPPEVAARNVKFRRPARRANHQLAVADLRNESVRRPLSVVGKRRRVDRLPFVPVSLCQHFFLCLGCRNDGEHGGDQSCEPSVFHGGRSE